ncbi:hypothetical protein [Streptacidiphilus neutrinimicus]|uniref:hypothetical protein n=1 Tax=Streptacidiphilus neutrinimicus TaxID=105420 RepID=UPI0005A99C20|nr:hypothetical protein [Streptacidiphilus neutrinimicus]
MTRDELNMLSARLHERAGGAPRSVEQALTALDAYLALSETRPDYPGLAMESRRAADLWDALQDAAAALAHSPAAATTTPTEAA